MSISTEQSEDEIRTHFRKERDRLKQASTKFDVFSKMGYREDAKALFTVQSKTYDWLASIYNDLEKLFIETHKLAVDFQKYKPILEHLDDYVKKVEKVKEQHR